MANKKFNPYDWIPKEQNNKNTAQPIPEAKNLTGIERDVDVIVRRIENYCLDLTINYEDWRNIGFAFASEFGETGRNYFHRVSRFYHGYDHDQCNRQYDKCLKRNKAGVTIKTFFYLAQGAGVNIRV